MKQHLLSAAIITTCSAYAGFTLADAHVTPYGKANISLNQVNLENTAGSKIQDNWELNSNASRIGIKGSYAINDNLKAIYKFEYEAFIDDGDDGSTTDDFSKDSSDSELKQRNIYAGLQGNFGTIIAGKHDTPVKLAQGKVDRFSDLVLGDIKNVMQGENRVDNIVMYTTPQFDGFAVTVAFIPGEDDGVAATTDDGLADGVSAAITYQADNFSITLAHDDGEIIDSSLESLTRLVGEYKGDGFKLGALYQVGEKSAAVGATDEDAYLLSGQFNATDKLIFKAQYAASDNETIDITQIAVGTDYKLDKKAKLFAYYSQIETEATTDSSDDTFGFGYEIKF